MLKLYSYFRSSAAYRVRIALNYKGLPYDIVPVHLVRDGGEQYQAAYTELNPQSLLPSMTLPDGESLNQSLAILEYLEEAYPDAPPLLPRAPLDRATVRAMAQHVACEIHPLNNLRVLKYLSNALGVSDEAKQAWYRHWIAQGFSAFEARLSKHAGQFCFGDTLSFADVCLIPQVYNAIRFDCPLTDYPRLHAIYEHCLTLACVNEAEPEAQLDAPASS